MSSEKLMLVDGNSILNRAYYGLQGPKLLATSYGLFTNAVFGFINIIFKYLEEEKPEYLCVAFDLKAPTFRHKEFDGYKAKRKGMPDELAVQVPVIKDVLDAMNIKRLESEGFEADDIIGTLSLSAENDGIDVIIITGDKDSLQLATTTTRIKMPTTRGGKTETEEYDINKVVEKYGVTPKQFIDVKGLMGDASDNIPGVPGIGEKTASELIKKFNDIENLYGNIDLVGKAGVKTKLTENKGLAFMSKRLAAIDRNIPELCSITDLRRRDFNFERLYELFKRLEFKNFIEKFKLDKAIAASHVPCNVTVIKEIGKLKSLKDDIALEGKIFSSNEFAIYHLIDKPESFVCRLSGAGISLKEGGTYYIDLTGSITEDYFISEFKEIFEDSRIKKYGHNIKDLIVYLKFKGVKFSGLCFDTMIGAYILNSSSDTYTLPELAHEYLKKDIVSIEQLSGKGKNHISYKDLPIGEISSAAGTYAEVVLSVSSVIDGIIRKNDQIELFYNIELPLVEALADMEYLGFKVDLEGLNKFSEDLERGINILINEIYMLAGEEFNINSTKQLGVLLYEKLNLPVLKKTKTGYSTDAEVLEQLTSKHEIVLKILEYRQLVKLKSTYVDGLINVINPVTGRIHSSFNQTVTATGRISSTEPNLQNIPIKLEVGRKIRKVFVPADDNFLLTDADYSQIELRVLAHITNDRNMAEAFWNNEDIHTSTASRIFNVSKGNVTSLMRSRAKTINFGIIYGMGDFSLSRELGITRKQAREYIDGYLAEYPNIKQYMNDIVEQGRTMGFVTTLFNRRRYLPELKSSNFSVKSFGERVAMNTPIQGSAADIIKIAMVKVYNELSGRKLKSRLILQVHDELIVETYVEEKEEVVEILKESMENSVKLIVPLGVEIKSGANWYETK